VISPRRPRVASGHFEALVPPPPRDFAARAVRVFVPHDGAEVRPALFLLDGQDVFSDDRAAGGGWGVDQAVAGLDLRRTAAPLVVAIPRDDARRAQELTPWPLEGGRGGEAFAFLHWVARAVVPAVRQRYALPDGALGAVLGGASWGGLCALCGHFAYPQVFGGALCLSPALWVGDFAARPWLEAQPTPAFSRIYLDCGAREAEGRMLPPARDLAHRLRARGYPRGQLGWRPDPRGEHTEDHWRRRLPRALRFMFRRG